MTENLLNRHRGENIVLVAVEPEVKLKSTVLYIFLDASFVKGYAFSQEHKH